MPKNKTLFQKMEEAVKKSKEKNKYILSQYSKDFFESDYDVITKELQPGDECVWVLNGDGKGTALIGLDRRIQTSPKDAVSFYGKKNRDQSVCFHIECNESNQGELKEISIEKAKELTVKEFPEDQFREPSRWGVSDYIEFEGGMTPGNVVLRAAPEVMVPARETSVFYIRINASKGIITIKREDQETGKKKDAHYNIGMDAFEHSDVFEFSFLATGHFDNRYIDYKPFTPAS